MFTFSDSLPVVHVPIAAATSPQWRFRLFVAANTEPLVHQRQSLIFRGCKRSLVVSGTVFCGDNQWLPWRESTGKQVATLNCFLGSDSVLEYPLDEQVCLPYAVQAKYYWNHPASPPQVWLLYASRVGFWASSSRTCCRPLRTNHPTWTSGTNARRYVHSQHYHPKASGIWRLDAAADKPTWNSWSWQHRTSCFNVNLLWWCMSSRIFGK